MTLYVTARVPIIEQLCVNELRYSFVFRGFEAMLPNHVR